MKTMTNRVSNIKIETLSKQWAKLEKVTFDYQLKDGRWVEQTRESYNRGDGAVILLYNKETEIRQKQDKTIQGGVEDGNSFKTRKYTEEPG